MINDKPYSFWGLVAVVLFAIVFLGSITSNVLLNKSVDIQRDSTAYWRGKYDSVGKTQQDNVIIIDSVDGDYINGNKVETHGDNSPAIISDKSVIIKQ